jgi:hypothetical protein
LQFNLGTVKWPETAVIGVLEGTMYPDQLRLTLNGGFWSTSFRVAAETCPFALRAVNLKVQCKPTATAGNVKVCFPWHLTRCGFGPAKKRGLDPSVHRVAPEAEITNFTRPP